MLNALKNKTTDETTGNPLGWTILDCLRTAKGEGKFSPPTFADVVCDENGNERPCCLKLHNETDRFTRQALDYMLWLVPDENVPEPTKSSENTTNETQKFEVSISETQVEKFPCDGLPCNYCSDHFGISTVLQPVQKPVVTQRINTG